MVAVGVLLDLLNRLTGMLGEGLVELLLHLQDLAHRDLHIGGLTLSTTERLMDHHARVREGKALPLSPRHEDDRCHTGSHAGGDGADVAVDVLHRVVDPVASIDRAAGAIDVDGDILAGVARLEEEELRLDYIGDIVVDGGAEEDDPVHHQSAEDVHLGDIELPLLDDGGIDVASGGFGIKLRILIQRQRVHPKVLRGVSLKFV